MTLSADVREAWDTFIWTPENFPEPVRRTGIPSTGLIESDVDELYFAGIGMNFFQCITKTFDQILICQQITQIVTVDISYYIEIAVNDDSYLRVIDKLETLRALVNSE